MEYVVPTAVSAAARHDFDFLFGCWKIHNRRLRNPLTNALEWYEFEAASTERPLLGGLANIEQYDAPKTPNGPIHAIALRLYDAEAHHWSIYWAKEGRGSFDVPMVGGFSDGVGRFFAREEYEGRPITVRFTWTPCGPTACRFEQAFSPDDGATWETNWIMEFTRTGA